MHQHLVNRARFPFAMHNAINKLVKCYFPVAIIQELEERGAFFHVQVEGLQVRVNVWKRQNAGQLLLCDHAGLVYINCSEQGFQLLHIDPPSFFLVDHSQICITLGRIKGVLRSFTQVGSREPRTRRTRSQLSKGIAPDPG